MKILKTVFIFLMAWNLNAQTDCACCDAVYAQFDFWVGEWNVSDSNGKMLGENKITKKEGNCLLMEQWTGGSGTTGISMNYYDKSDSTWNQLWVDNQGNILKLKGIFTSGKMVLKGSLQESPKGEMVYNQISWSPDPEGTVTQIWEVYNQEGDKLQTLFKGIYSRKN